MPACENAAKLTLTEVELGKLRLLISRPKSSQREAFRARIILDLADGYSGQEVAQCQDTSNQTVSKWRRRFAEHRLEGLVEAPRSGPPRRLDDALIEAVVTCTLKSVPAARTH